MRVSLVGKRALVTGASQGIGRGIVEVFARLGVRCVTAARRKDILEEHAQELIATGGVAPVPIEVDLFEDKAASYLFEQAESALGGVDILVNAAGRSKAPDAPRQTPFNHPSELWEKELHLNYVVLRELTFMVLPSMQERKYGRVINVTGKSEPEKLSTANPPKAAVHAWAKGLSRLIALDGVTINQISPGKIVSEQIIANYSASELEAYSKKDIPLGRLGNPEELGYLAAFLASPQAGYITGAVIPVDGGMKRYAF